MPGINHTFGSEEQLCLVRKNRIPNHAPRSNLSVSAVLSKAQTMLADAGVGREPNARGGNTHEAARGQIITSRSSYSAPDAPYDSCCRADRDAWRNISGQTPLIRNPQV